jgi:hypothetical protein
MADNDPNKKDIQDAKAELDKYNDTLRESINYAKELSKQIENSTKNLKISGGFNKENNKNLISGVESYERTLKKTLELSEKAAKGKIKEKDVQKQINELAAGYEKFQKDNAKYFEDGSEILNKQKSIQQDIQRIEEEQLRRKQDIATADTKLDAFRKKMAEAEEKAATTSSSTQKRIQQNRVKALKDLIKDQVEVVTALEKEEKNQEKILSQKVKEKAVVDDIIETYKDIEISYQKQIEQNNALFNIAKKESLLAKLRSKDAEKFNEGLKEATVLLAPIVAAFDIIKKFAFGISDQVTRLQKNLVLSRDEAYDLRQDFNNMAESSGDIAVNTNRLIDATIALGQQLGFSSKFTRDLNIQFIKLTKQIGLSEEAAGGLAKLSVATGKTLEESKNVALETSQRLSSQYGIQLNQREVLEEIGKISGQTLAMFKASPQALAQAVAQAKLLGTNLDTVRKQAKSLLDFETSIENELQAELLTGQQLNLERARSASLAGDLTTAMKELNNQNIDFNKFSNMNVIAQEKVASALGLSADELSDQLLKQQYLGKSQEEVAALAGDEVAKRLEALSAQDKFNLAMEKMQDIVGRIVGGPLGQLADAMASLMENSFVLYSTLALMAGLSFTKLVAGLAASAVQSGLLAASSVTWSSALTFGVGAIAIAAAIGLVMSAFAKAKDEAAQPVGDMLSSNGKTTVSTKEGGLFELSNNDDFAAAPGIGDMIANTNKQAIIAQDNTEMLNMLAGIRDEMRNTNKGVDKLYNKEAKVNLGAQTIGTAQLMYNTNLA